MSNDVREPNTAILWFALFGWLTAAVIVSAITWNNRSLAGPPRMTTPVIQENSPARQTPPLALPPSRSAPTPIVLATPVPTAAAVPITYDPQNDPFGRNDDEMAGEVRTYSVVDRVVKLEIRTNDAQQCHLVRLYGADHHRLVMSVFVKGGQTQPVRVPVGRFIMKVASGANWHGYHGFFGPETRFTKMDTVFDFTPGYSHWVTLYTLPGGNLTTSVISKDEF